MNRFLLPVALLCITTLALAKPVPAERPQPRITAKNANQIKKLAEIPLDVWRIAFGPKQGEMVLLGWEGPAAVYELATLERVGTIGKDKRLVGFSLSTSRDFAALVENNTFVEILPLRGGKPLFLNTLSSQPATAFSPDDKLLATGGSGTQVKLWDCVTGQVVRSFDVGPVEGGLTPTFSPDGKLLAVGHRNSTTGLFEVQTGKLLHTLDKKMSQELRFSPDGKTLAVTYVDGSLGLWDVAEGTLRHARQTSAAELYTVAWSPGGDVLATAGRKGPITLWNSSDLSILKELEAPEWLIQVRFSPDGSRLLTSGGSVMRSPDRKLTVWGLGQGARE
jgi:WD40 repeat protein